MAGIECTKSGCVVQTSGVCIDGHSPPEACPNATAIQGADDADFGGVELVNLPTGEALDEAQAEAVMREVPAKVVVVAGPTGSGKTTILTSMFEAFLEAPISNFEFRGSKTLVGFERRCHDGREDSGRAQPETSRTSVREGVVFLHLELGSRVRDFYIPSTLLVTDISGELFKRVRDSADVAVSLACLRRADHLCLALDGEKLASQTDRHVARTDCRSTLRSILETNVLPEHCTVDLAVTKWDAILSNDESLEIREFLAATVESLRKLVSLPRTFRVFEIAARPTSEVLPFAHGVPTLLRAWMQEEAFVSATPTPPDVPVDCRDFDRFTPAVLQRRKRRAA